MHMSLHPALFHMASPHFGEPKTRKIVERWAALAEQRLGYLTELFDSGRWRRFHSEAEFLDNIAEAKDAVLRWRAMANGEFVAPVIRAAPPLQPIMAAIEPRLAAPAHDEIRGDEIDLNEINDDEAGYRDAEVLSFEDHAAQRDAARTKSLLVEQDEAAEKHDVEAAAVAAMPLDLFDHDAIVARYPMLRAAM